MMSNCSFISLSLVLLLVMLGAGRVGAAPRSPFQQHYETALSLYSAGKLEEAVKEFEAAYELKRLPRLLINIAELYRKLGHPREALKFYELYQQMEPSPPAKIQAQVDGALAEVRRAIEMADQSEAKEREIGQGAVGPGRGAKSKAGALPGGGAVPPTSPAIEVPSSVAVAGPTVEISGRSGHPGPLYKKWWLWTAVAVAATGAAIGFGVGLSQHGADPPPSHFGLSIVF